MRQIDLIHGLRDAKNNRQKKSVIEKYLKQVSIDKITDFIDFYQYSLQVLHEEGNPTDADKRLRKERVATFAGSYALKHRIGSYLVTGEFKSPSDEIPRKRNIRNPKPISKLTRIFQETKNDKQLIKKLTTYLREEIPQKAKALENFYYESWDRLRGCLSAETSEDYLMARDMLPLPSEQYSYNHQIACIAANRPLKTPKQEVIQSKERRKMINGCTKKAKRCLGRAAVSFHTAKSGNNAPGPIIGH